jgi:putative aminopeptidase
VADMRALISKLTSLHGVSGSEQEVVRYLYDALAAVSDTCEVDPWGNVVATKQGTTLGGLRLMIGAHSDEIGFYVKSIDDRGFLRIEPVGGVPMALMPGRPVRVGNADGVIGVGAWHLGKQSGGVPLYVDVGAESREEAGQLGVRVGSPVTLVSEARFLGEHRVSAKAMDNRVACAVLLGVLEALHGVETAATLVGVVTVQEEVGLRGAHMVAGRVPVSAAISVDIMVTGDTPDCDGTTDSTVRLGQGPVITLFDQIEEAFAASLIGVIGHPRLNERLFEVAQAAGIPVQPNVLIGGGADAAAFQLARGGVPVTMVSVPTRYSHSMVETLDLRDVEHTVRLLVEFTRSLDRGLSLEFL